MGSEVLTAKTSFIVIERLSSMDSAKHKATTGIRKMVLLDTTEYVLMHMLEATIPRDWSNRSKMIDRCLESFSRERQEYLAYLEQSLQQQGFNIIIITTCYHSERMIVHGYFITSCNYNIYNRL